MREAPHELPKRLGLAAVDVASFAEEVTVSGAERGATTLLGLQEIREGAGAVPPVEMPRPSTGPRVDPGPRKHRLEPCNFHDAVRVRVPLLRAWTSVRLS